MKRTGFTMIELVFVIVILGILSAVALPKFIGVSSQAHDEKVKAFVATLNASIGAMMWSDSMSHGYGGAINHHECDDLNTTYTNDVPTELQFVQDGCKFDNVDGGGSTLKVTFTEGNVTNSPRWIAVAK